MERMNFFSNRSYYHAIKYQPSICLTITHRKTTIGLERPGVAMVSAWLPFRSWSYHSILFLDRDIIRKYWQRTCVLLIALPKGLNSKSAFMEYGYDFPKSRFYRALMTGFSVGFMATVVCLVYNIIYRNSTGFPLSFFINVSTLIFLVNILFPIIGIIYYGFISAFKKADVPFMIVFILLTGFLIWRTELMHRTNDHLVNTEFKNLLAGILIILGISAAVVIPLLYHSKKFEDAIL